jgi:acetylornithine deacetylase/succinyl-diaminopimelate desuccinylase-like protein
MCGGARRAAGGAYDPGVTNTDLAGEAQGLLRELIRFDTVNPPGNERAAQEHLAAHLREAGLECELLGAEPERPNLVARLRGGDGDSARSDSARRAPAGPGSARSDLARRDPGGPDPAGAGPTLCYLGHVDTVLADPGDWTHDPWSGDVAGGCMWGRGALDMKSQVAAEVAAAAALARSGWRPAKGELLIVAVVDEETGGRLGAEWITREHPRKVRCDMLVNEGAGGVFEYGGARRYGVCCAEKGVFRFTLTTDGVAGHASMPSMGENALLKMAPLLERLGARQPAYALTDVPRAFLEAIGEDPADLAGSVARLREADARLATMFEPMLGVTFAPTRIGASEKINVIPSRAVLKVDCRVPPGLGEAEVRRALAEVLEPADPAAADPAVVDPAAVDPAVVDPRRPATDAVPPFRIEFTERVIGNRSPVASPLMDAISAWVREHDPGARTAPTILPGFTDSRHFRAAFPECVAYGFFPQRHQTLVETAPLIHGADERIDVRDLAFAAEFYRDLARRVLG